MPASPTRTGQALTCTVLLAVLLAAGSLLLAARPVRATPVFIVTTVGDEPDFDLADDRCDVNTATGGDQCTLRAAIQQANATPGHDTIRFAIPGPGLKTIRPASELPPITEQTTIDGYTQPGTRPNTAAVGTNAVLRIVLDGFNAGVGADGLDVTNGANTQVRGLVINRFGGNGISIATGASDTHIAGCFLGTNAAGTAARANGSNGVNAEGPNTSVGGATLGARNLLSGNGVDGVKLDGGAIGSRVLNNLIGTTKTGTAPLGNSDDGVDTRVTDVTLGSNLASGSNVIAFNVHAGVTVRIADTSRNRILRNSIFSNGDLGIDLFNDGVTANDAGDADTGPNTLQNFPIITVATSNTVQGTFNSTPNRTFSLRLFSNPGTSNEGKFFEAGPLTVTTDNAGNATFTFTPSPPIPTGRSVTATATSDAGNTSEFSAKVPVI